MEMSRMWLQTLDYSLGTNAGVEILNVGILYIEVSGKMRAGCVFVAEGTVRVSMRAGREWDIHPWLIQLPDTRS